MESTSSTTTTTQPWYLKKKVQLAVVVTWTILIIAAIAIGSTALTIIETRKNHKMNEIRYVTADGSNVALSLMHQIDDPGQDGVVDLSHSGTLFLGSCNVRLPTPTEDMAGKVWCIVAGGYSSGSCVGSIDNTQTIQTVETYWEDSSGKAVGALTWYHNNGNSPWAIALAQGGHIIFTVVFHPVPGTGKTAAWWHPLETSAAGGVGYWNSANITATGLAVAST